MRITRQKQIIISALSRRTDHPTALEIYSEVKGIIPKISLGTVYRNLDTLTEMGLVQVLQAPGKEKHYDSRAEQHCHFRCRSCGLIEDIPEHILSTRTEGSDPWFRGRIVEGFSLEITGLCPKCTEKRSAQRDA